MIFFPLFFYKFSLQFWEKLNFVCYYAVCFNGIVIYSTQLHLISKSHFQMKIIKMSKLCIFWDSSCEVIQSESKLILSGVKLNFFCNLEWSLISFVTTICKHFIDIVVCSTQLRLISKSHFSHWKSKNCRFSIMIQFFKIFWLAVQILLAK